MRSVMRVPRRARARVFAAAATGSAAALLFPAWPARAVEYLWTNGNGGTFSTPGNWAGGPGGTFPDDATDNATFDLDDPGYTVTFSGSVTNGTVRVRTDVVTFNLGANTYAANGSLSMGDAAG